MGFSLENSSVPCVAIPFHVTPFPHMLLNVIPFIVLSGVSFAVGERYGNSSRLSCIYFGRRNGFSHVFRVNIRHRNTATRLPCASRLLPLSAVNVEALFENLTCIRGTVKLSR
jgi:hypothetical protein